MPFLVKTTNNNVIIKFADYNCWKLLSLLNSNKVRLKLLARGHAQDKSKMEIGKLQTYMAGILLLNYYIKILYYLSYKTKVNFYT